MTLLHEGSVNGPLLLKNALAAASSQARTSGARVLGGGSAAQNGALNPHRRSSAGAEISGTGPHILTIALEDYYQVGAFNHVIQRGQWYRFERRIEYSTNRTLDLLDQFHARATFFVLGWIADTMPELIRQVADRGHEIASKGYYHRNIGQLTPSEFRDDLSRAREALERAAGTQILGYRVADSWFQPNDLWALDVLAEEGYEYDSSIGPILRTYHAEPWRRFAHLHRYGERTLWELPISTADVFGFLIPIAGGNYFRQLPHHWVRRSVASWARTYTAPYVMYFHTWELDPNQPKIASASWFSACKTVSQSRPDAGVPPVFPQALRVHQRCHVSRPHPGGGPRGRDSPYAAPIRRDDGEESHPASRRFDR